MSVFVTLFLMLVIILIAAEVFTNALEHLGEKLKISEGVTGSLFAAVGTALPETMVPLLAIFAGTDDKHLNEEIGVGAILGAPLMLITLSIALLAVATFRKRTLAGHFTPEKTGFIRDLNFFLFAFTLAAIAMFIPHDMDYLRIFVGASLVLTYFVYVMMTLRASKQLVQEGHATESHAPMLLNRIGLPTNYITIIFQLALGLGLLIFGAKGFIGGVQEASAILGISALLLSLLIIPIATELPEKFNSILWIRRHKDTMAFGNLTGAMVFQGTLLPAIGITLTPWSPRPEVMAGIIIALLGALWLRFLISCGQLRVWHVLVNGGLYVLFIAIVLG